MKTENLLTKVMVLLIVLLAQTNQSAFAERKVISNVPYIHQVLDMDEREFDGNWACGGKQLTFALFLAKLRIVIEL